MPEEGESIIQCVIREVREETGLTIKNFQSIGFASDPETEIVSYPNGDQSHSFSLIVYATEWSGDLSDTNEETLALGFFSPTDLPPMHKTHRRTIEKFLQYKTTGQFQLY